MVGCIAWIMPYHSIMNSIRQKNQSYWSICFIFRKVCDFHLIIIYLFCFTFHEFQLNIRLMTSSISNEFINCWYFAVKWNTCCTLPHRILFSIIMKIKLIHLFWFGVRNAKINTKIMNFPLILLNNLVQYHDVNDNIAFLMSTLTDLNIWFAFCYFLLSLPLSLEQSSIFFHSL